MLLAMCRSRGLDQQTARQMLVYSFGKEVTQKLRYAQAQARVAATVTALLAATQLAKDRTVSIQNNLQAVL